MPAPELASLSSRLSAAAPQVFRNLTVVPLIDGAAMPTGFPCLDRALDDGVAVVTEVSEQGTVPRLKFLIKGPQPVFLLDGEELVGAKQNRILNLSILAPGNAELEIPVSCVEQGRWSWRSREFKNSERVIYSKLRRRNSEEVSASMLRSADPSGNQGAVWDSIASKSARMSVHSDTSAASAIFERYGHALDEFVDQVKILPAQVGAAFFVNDRFSGLDLLGGPDLVGSLLPKIVRSYAIDALEDEGSDGGLSPIDDVVKTSVSESEGRAAVLEVIERVGRLAASRTKAAGLGEDLRLRDDSLIGAALVSSGAVVHLAVWSAAYR